MYSGWHGKMDRFEIDKDDIKLLKAMMFATYRSKYKVGNVTEIPYANLLRKMEKLAEYQMIEHLSEEENLKKDGTPDKRGPQTWAISVKGLAYLIVNDLLKDADLEKALMRLFSSDKKLKGLRHIMNIVEYRSVFIQGMIEAMSEMRSKINFQYFDTEYVLSLFLPLMEVAFLRRIEKMQTCNPEELKRLVKRTGTKNQLYKWYKKQLEDAKLQRKGIENKIGCYNTIIRFVRNIR